MNIAILVGKVVSEPTVQKVRDGTVTRFRLKTVEQYTLDGEIKERPQTHLIDIWNRYLQTNMGPMIRQGQTLHLQGSIQSRNTAREGEPARWTTSIVLGASAQLTIMGGPGSNTAVQMQGQEDRDDSGAARNPGTSPRIDHSNRRTPAATESDGLDDDVPF
jgi:hypothetical protein